MNNIKIEKEKTKTDIIENYIEASAEKMLKLYNNFEHFIPPKCLFYSFFRLSFPSKEVSYVKYCEIYPSILNRFFQKLRS
jgi:hypothetical protein